MELKIVQKLTCLKNIQKLTPKIQNRPIPKNRVRNPQPFSVSKARRKLNNLIKTKINAVFYRVWNKLVFIHGSLIWIFVVILAKNDIFVIFCYTKDKIDLTKN
jgi:hypothetical protein